MLNAVMHPAAAQYKGVSNEGAIEVARKMVVDPGLSNSVHAINLDCPRVFLRRRIIGIIQTILTRSRGSIPRWKRTLPKSGCVRCDFSTGSAERFGSAQGPSHIAGSRIDAGTRDIGFRSEYFECVETSLP